MNSDQRINELKTRQVWYGSSMVVKLRKEEGILHYDVFAWVKSDTFDTKFSIITGIYNNEDPETLISMALFDLQAKKIKLGVIQN